MQNVLIRKATLADMSAIYDLVIALAVYENEPDAVVATLEEYQDNFQQNVFYASVAEAQGKVIGMALYYLTYSTWKGRMLYLEDFVVYEEYRRKGIGQLLFDATLATAKEMNCKLLKWQVLDWNEPALEFYRKNKAIIEKEWWNGKIFFDGGR